jgi:hypothetical protein
MPNSYKDKMVCCNSLSILKNTIDISSCIIGGYFYTQLKTGEINCGGKIIEPFSENLIDLITYWDLQDIKPSKEKCMWNNRQSSLCHIVAHPYHFLIIKKILLSHQDISSHILPSIIYDHKPISLNFKIPQKVLSLPFHFNLLWIENPTIPPIINNVWSTTFSGSLNYIWESNIKVVKLALKYWVKTLFIPPQQGRKEKIEKLMKFHL